MERETQFKNVPQSFDLATFKRTQDRMIATNDNAYSGGSARQTRTRVRQYTKEEITRIIDAGSLIEQQKLSRNYFARDGFYKQIIIHYATLLKYVGVLIPNPGYGKSLSTPHISKKYFQAMDYVDRMNIPSFCVNCATRALTDGAYYGVILQNDKSGFVVMDLPCGYCASNYKDFAGNDVIEFDLSYFNSIYNRVEREEVLKLYPKEISTAYKAWQNGKRKDKWVIIPSGVGICFSFFDGRPMFLNVIPATIDYEETKNNERERVKEEIRKIIVQKVPHLPDGRLLFEPEEAEVMHAGSVGMLKGNKNISVLTTYADVDAIASKTGTEGTGAILDQMMKDIYSQAGVSEQLFGSTGSTTLKQSINNDIAMMMYLANKFATFVTTAINRVHSNSNISFRYIILPVSIHNEEEYITSSFKMASSGYSWVVPAVAMGISQKDLLNLKDLENDVLKLDERLKPLASAFTQSGDESEDNGRPAKEQENKAPKTIENEESLDNQTEGGSK